MKKGKTKSGFNYSIPESINNDYELIEQLIELDDNPLLLTKIVIRVLGKEQSNLLKEHLRDENGLVPSDKMMEEITEIFTNSGEELKNS